MHVYLRKVMDGFSSHVFLSQVKSSIKLTLASLHSVLKYCISITYVSTSFHFFHIPSEITVIMTYIMTQNQIFIVCTQRRT